jgi:hypothetical protein
MDYEKYLTEVRRKGTNFGMGNLKFKFMGQANSAMGNFLTEIEDMINDHMDKMRTLNQPMQRAAKLEKDFAQVDADWEKLWSKIVKIIRAFPEIKV